MFFDMLAQIIIGKVVLSGDFAPFAQIILKGEKDEKGCMEVIQGKKASGSKMASMAVMAKRNDAILFIG